MGSIDEIPGPVLLVGRDGSCLRASSEARELLGGAFGDHLGGKDRLEPLEEIARTSLAERREINTETEIEVDGDEKVLDVTARPIPKQDAALFVLNDVTSYTERLETERKQRRVLQEAQEIAGIGSWQWDLRTDEVEWSDHLYEVFGRDRDTFEPSFQSYIGCLHPDDVEKVRSLVQQGLESGQAFTFEHRILTSEGEVRRLHCRAEIVTDPGGTPVRMVGTAQELDGPVM